MDPPRPHRTDVARPSSLAAETQTALLSALLGQTADAIAFVGLDLRIRLANDECTRRLGLAPEAVVGHPAERLLPLDGGEAERLFEEVRRSGETFRGSDPALAAICVAPVHGTRHEFLGYLVSDRAAPAATDAGAIPVEGASPLRGPAPAGVLRSEQTASEAALHEQFQQLSTIFDSMDALLYVADMETHELLYMNAYGEALFGRDAVGRACYHALQAGQTGPCAFCTNDRLLLDGEALPPHVWEFRNTITGRWFQCIDRAIRWTDGRWVRMEVAVDISERKRAEEFRRHYVHTISHDLRDPLMTILGHAELLLLLSRSPDLSQPQRRSLEAIVQATHRMNVMIRDLVDSARVEGGSLELQRGPIELTRFLHDLVQQSRGVLEIDRVRVEVPEQLPRADADPDRLERIVVNLLANALKYSPSAATVRIAATLGDGEVVLSVVDQGRGIDPGDVPHIFERYYRTKAGRESGGVGLGLYITRMLVEAHGGSIWVDSTPGGGSTFSFTLPTSPTSV